MWTVLFSPRRLKGIQKELEILEWLVKQSKAKSKGARRKGKNVFVVPMNYLS